MLGYIALLSSVLLFNARLYLLDRYLRDHHPELWARHGFGRKGVLLLTKWHGLRMLAISHNSDDPQLNRKLSELCWLWRSYWIGLSLIGFDMFFDMSGL